MENDSSEQLPLASLALTNRHKVADNCYPIVALPPVPYHVKPPRLSDKRYIQTLELDTPDTGDN